MYIATRILLLSTNLHAMAVFNCGWCYWETHQYCILMYNTVEPRTPSWAFQGLLLQRGCGVMLFPMIVRKSMEVHCIEDVRISGSPDWGVPVFNTGNKVVLIVRYTSVNCTVEWTMDCTCDDHYHLLLTLFDLVGDMCGCWTALGGFRDFHGTPFLPDYKYI